MYKWDRLIKGNKLANSIVYMKDDAEKAEEVDMDLYSKEEMPENTLKNEDEFEIVEMEILPNKIVCPDCGGITLEGLEFCDKCAGEI